MTKWWDREPVLILTALGNVIALAVAFGVDISTGQKAAVLAVVASGLALFGRAQVTPVADPRGPVTPVAGPDLPGGDT